MTASKHKRKALVVLGLLALAPAANAAEPKWPFGQGVTLELSVLPTLLDYEVPGHPKTVGVGHVGVISDAVLRWTYDKHVDVLLGVRGRLPFAFDLDVETAAIPIFGVVLRPYGDLATIRFGTLDHRHGFHPAVLDEARYNYGRPLEDTYNQSIVPEAHRDIRDLAMGAETGAQLVLQSHGFRADLFLEWQLLETETHREKFGVGVLTEYNHRWVQVGFQYRLIHYGGQRFTKTEEIRRSGLDRKRQPTTLAATLTPVPLDLGWLKIRLPMAYIRGKVVQSPGAAEAAHSGVEAGIEVTFSKMVTLGYRIWLPKDNTAAYVSEDAEPVYSGQTSHRARLALVQHIGPATLRSRLDLIFPKGSNDVQYLTVTTVELAWQTLLFGDSKYP
jgi:hypothetical protein